MSFPCISSVKKEVTSFWTWPSFALFCWCYCGEFWIHTSRQNSQWPPCALPHLSHIQRWQCHLQTSAGGNSPSWRWSQMSTGATERVKALWSSCAADDLIRHTVVEPQILWSVSEVVDDPRRQSIVYSGCLQFPSQQCRLNGVEHTGEIKSHVPHRDPHLR